MKRREVEFLPRRDHWRGRPIKRRPGWLRRLAEAGRLSEARVVAVERVTGEGGLVLVADPSGRKRNLGRLFVPRMRI